MNHKTKTPSFHVGPIPVYGHVILAPMAGFSDLPYRSICRELGSAMSYSEFVSTEAIIRDNQKSLRMLRYATEERPVVFQIFGANPEVILEAAKRISELQPDIIDINMGCSVKKVSGKGAGAALLKDPSKIGHIFNLLSRELPFPVTGKIRLGWDHDSLNYRDVVRAMQENGAQLVAVHGRTKKQAYQGQANWDAIAEIKSMAQIPVIGNGDVTSVADIKRMRDHTGCDAVMIARAAIGNPWIFAGKNAEDVTLAEKLTMIRRHLAANLEFYEGDYGLILFRKHVAKYISGIHGARELRAKLVTARSAADFANIVTAAEQQTTEENLISH
ncbi:MAG: tRNA dihydrouridine synthase DusB [Deferribacteres bacterium]|nr:tRNA dihydrouridine synthase DusB [candidate division KSB1 bacterium]MCB9500795.1 tRNA dihydrouridine synthase DusB [Deferribacteres bacterium]